MADGVAASVGLRTTGSPSTTSTTATWAKRRKDNSEVGPTALDTLLAEGAWTVLYDGAVLRWGVASQVLVATPRSP